MTETEVQSTNLYTGTSSQRALDTAPCLLFWSRVPRAPPPFQNNLTKHEQNQIKAKMRIPAPPLSPWSIYVAHPGHDFPPTP